MRLLVSSHLDHSLCLNVDPFDKITTVKNRIGGLIDINPHNFCLSYGGKPLSEDETLFDLDVEDCSKLDVNSELLGGGKKRKKKVYTSLKKIKHKKRKVKLQVLKYYKVDGNKVQRLRKECTNNTCGTGIFMASHFDRQYCGKCTLTFFQRNK